MTTPRWYPSPIRTTGGKIFSFGGSQDGGSGIQQQNFDIYDPVTNTVKLVNSPVLVFAGIAGYPSATIIPNTGDIFLFVKQYWAILDQNTGNEKVSFQWDKPCVGVRGGAYPGGFVLLLLSCFIKIYSYMLDSFYFP
jgi:hypothetical protein